jgi:hypothetical protein
MAPPGDRQLRGEPSGQRDVPGRAGSDLDGGRRPPAALRRPGLSLPLRPAAGGSRGTRRAASQAVLDPAQLGRRFPARCAHRRPGLVAPGRLPGRRRASTSTRRHWPSGPPLARHRQRRRHARQAGLLAEDAARPGEQAGEHFLRLVAGLDGMDGVDLRPFDAELFGTGGLEERDLARARAGARGTGQRRRGDDPVARARCRTVAPPRLLRRGLLGRRRRSSRLGQPGDRLVLARARRRRALGVRGRALGRQPPLAAGDPESAPARRRLRLAVPGHHGDRTRLRRQRFRSTRTPARAGRARPRTLLPDWAEATPFRRSSRMALPRRSERLSADEPSGNGSPLHAEIELLRGSRLYDLPTTSGGPGIRAPAASSPPSTRAPGRSTTTRSSC